MLTNQKPATTSKLTLNITFYLNFELIAKLSYWILFFLCKNVIFFVQNTLWEEHLQSTGTEYLAIQHYTILVTLLSDQNWTEKQMHISLYSLRHNKLISLLKPCHKWARTSQKRQTYHHNFIIKYFKILNSLYNQMVSNQKILYPCSSIFKSQDTNQYFYWPIVHIRQPRFLPTGPTQPIPRIPIRKR